MVQLLCSATILPRLAVQNKIYEGWEENIIFFILYKEKKKSAVYRNAIFKRHQARGKRKIKYKELPLYNRAIFCMLGPILVLYTHFIILRLDKKQNYDMILKDNVKRLRASFTNVGYFQILFLKSNKDLI